MNKIEVISRNTYINDFINNVSLMGDEDTLFVKIRGLLEEQIWFKNNFYSNVVFVTDDNTVVNISELKEASNNYINYKYVINNNSKMIINKFYCLHDYNEEDSVQLDGIQSDILFNLSVMSKGTQKYNINIKHNNKNTSSRVYNHGVSFSDSSIEFVVNGNVEKGMINSTLNQDNRIMTINNGKGSIKPNLFINEHKIEARHGASIGRFNEDEIFYLETRGIDREAGYQLLLKGFLVGNLIIEPKKIETLHKMIEDFRR